MKNWLWLCLDFDSTKAVCELSVKAQDRPVLQQTDT